MRRSALVLVLALLAAGAVAAPSARGGVTPVSSRPDGHVAKANGPTLGDDIYNNTGDGQTASARIRRPRYVTFTLTFQNDGTSTDTFTIFGCPAPAPHDGWEVAYFDGTTEVSSELRNGRTTTLAPGGSSQLTLKVRIRKASVRRPRACFTDVVGGGGAAVDTIGARVRQV